MGWGTEQCVNTIMMLYPVTWSFLTSPNTLFLTIPNTLFLPLWAGFTCDILAFGCRGSPGFRMNGYRRTNNRYGGSHEPYLNSS